MEFLQTIIPYLHVNIRMFSLGKIEAQFAPAVRLTYLGETYETDGNPIISSQIDVTLRGALKLAPPIHTNTRLTAGIDIFHYSKRAYKVANNCMNILCIGLGIKRLGTKEL